MLLDLIELLWTRVPFTGDQFSINHHVYHRLRSFPVNVRYIHREKNIGVGMGGGKRRVETGSGRGDPEDNVIINQIMLRFQPIAPRPVTAESTAGLVPVKEKRVKRKYVRVKKKKKQMSEDECNFTNFTNLTMKDDDKSWMSLDKTVSLLEVTNGTEFVTDPLRKVPKWISFGVSGNNRWITPSAGVHDVDLTMKVTRRQLVESWITMESVIGTCEDAGREMRYTDEEIWKDLDMDSCPGFISNGYDEVQWVNQAYRKMVDPDPDGGAGPPEVVVWLGVKVEKSAFEYWPAFSCRVKVVYDVLPEKKKQMTVPCDVWKMDSGGYAWRLDIKAALSL